jgi:hypothetical protein
MKIRITLMTLTVALGLGFGGCTEEENPINGGGTNYGVPTGLKVNSVAADKIGAMWTRAADDIGADTLIAIAPSGAEVKEVIAAGTSSGVISGLSANVLYTIKVASTGGRTAGIEWATATRSGMLTLYETFDNTAGHFSGLILGPTPRTASTEGPDSLLIDVVLATDNSVPKVPFLSLQGANVVGSGIPTGRSCYFANNVFSVKGGLNNDYYTTSFASQITNKKYYDEFGDAPDSSSIIIGVVTEDNHYARIEVVPQTNGKVWKDVPITGGSARAIDVIVSYQPLTGKGYASRPFNTVRREIPKVKGEGATLIIKN